MIINIRGVNGSGKSHVVRQVMGAAASVRPYFGALGLRYPEGYRLELATVPGPALVAGPYTQPAYCGSEPLIKYLGVEKFLEILTKCAGRGHLLFEGLIISGHVGRTGAWLESYGSASVVAFMSTPLEECIRRIGERRGRRSAWRSRDFDPEKTVIPKYKQILRAREMLEERGLVRVVSLSEEYPAGDVLRLLESADG